MSARSDLIDDPAVQQDLLLARRGQAYFLRGLFHLPDAQLSAVVTADGATKGAVVAAAALRARLLADALDRLTGVESEGTWDEIDTADSFADAVVFAATLPPLALRHLATHSGVHLNVSWRDLPPALWREHVYVAGARLTISETPLWRAQEIWRAAILLGNGRSRDVPAQLRDVVAAET
ncbi:maleylpyruvate isomerase [Microbacterium album]|uniref:Mycothiol-dependent maleylpyruvate isomerase metal-binding domain-containing protein n=1 Tax=Microbacterium album TaxID=2053191 RepID=A0A917IID8_9MICO|nr:maleylpyruvate isomerase [Microbacterium album]GGH47376.1 hypothetical protein GCM10010921_24050 [Microbacterium album]